MSEFNPYAEALATIKRNPGTSGAAGLAKLVLSLYNELCGFAYSECIGSLDGNNTALAIKMVTHYSAHGETNELREVGKELVEKHYPSLWELGIAMRTAREDTREKWAEDARKEERDALDAAEAALFIDPAKQVPASKAKELLSHKDPLYASYNVAGEWRDSNPLREAVHAAIDQSGAELRYNCPDGKRLAVRIDLRILYVCLDYDACEEYLATIEPSRKAIPRGVTIPPRGTTPPRN